MIENNLMIDAAFKRPITRTPIWIMRQAGRYLAEYRKVREVAGDFLTLCKTPEFACEVSMQPLDLIGVDGVIMFSDILTPLVGMGMELDFSNGPKFNNPISNLSQVKALKLPEPDQNVPYVGEILRRISSEVRNRVPIIGFAGAPFTLAAYMVEGKSSHQFIKLKTMCFNAPEISHALLEKLTRMTIDYLNYQITEGAQYVQLFDTWAGSLNPDDYDVFVFPYVQQIFSNLKQKGKVPQVYYINGGNHLLEKMAKTGADVVGLDWRTDLSIAKTQIGKKVSLQGNLDPNVLFACPDVVKTKAREIIDKFGKESGHIFNLGHGIHKDVNPEHLKILINEVKNYGVH